mmetsp:Transcript_32657/g.75925  ORF Transcript_32657/g.75925 Transcript_32657/m.75925 type:complete len:279 (+) Transcript_32657:59-895(+)
MAHRPSKPFLRHGRHRALGGRAAALASLIAALACVQTPAFTPCRSSSACGARRLVEGPWRAAVSPWALDAPEETLVETLVEEAEEVEEQEAKEERTQEEQQEKQKKDLIPVEDLEVGQTLQGVVQGRWQQLGVFVDVGVTERAFLRVSEMGDHFPGHRITVKKGDEVTVRVLDIKDGKYSVTMRSGPLPRPSKEELGTDVFSFLVQDWFEAEVDHIVTWGAFVRVWPGAGRAPVLGLLHKAQWRKGFEDEIEVGARLKVRVIAANGILGRIDVTNKEP